MNFSDSDIQEFLVEAADMLDQAESTLLTLDKGGDFKSHFDSVFRVFHSLKGGSGMLGLNDLQKHMHAVENILSSSKTKTQFSKDEINFFLKAIDAARQIISGQKIDFSYEIHSAESSPALFKSSVPEVSAQEKNKKKFKGTAVVLDDEPDILESICDILELAEIQSTSFTDARLALEACKKNPPDLILTDLKMPTMSGLTFLKEVRKFDSGVPVIIVSGFITSEALMEAIEEGVFSVLEKPFSQTSLTNLALAAIRQHQMYKMFRQSLFLILYQFADLDDFLKANGKAEVAATARNEINGLIAQWKKINHSKK